MYGLARASEYNNAIAEFNGKHMALLPRFSV